jgi:hypothetical protein
MALSCGVSSVAFTVYSGLQYGWTTDLVSGLFGVWLVTGLYSLLLGYIYVLLAAISLSLFRKAGWVLPPPVSSFMS